MRLLFCLCVCVCLFAFPSFAASPASPPAGVIGVQLPDGSDAAATPGEAPIPVYVVEREENSSSLPFSVTGSPYDGGLSSSTLSFFSGIMRKYSGVDYVAFRSDQYEYILCYGDISLSGSVFSSSSVTVVRYSTRYDTTVSESTESFNLNAGSQPVYSSLGSYPELEGVSDVVWQKVGSVALAFFALLFILFCFFRPRSR